MKPVAIVYATREGHTRHIAQHLGEVVGAQHRLHEVIDAAHVPSGFSLTRYSAAVIAASLHMGSHEREMTRFVKSHLAELQQLPTLFLSVSLAESIVEDTGSPEEKRAAAEAEVQKTIQKFLAETGWHPGRIAAVAGALLYSKYNFVMRFVMKRIAKQTGHPVDTSRDYEYTDWGKLDHLVTELIPEVAAGASE